MILKKIACGLLCAAMLLAAGCGGVGSKLAVTRLICSLPMLQADRFRLPKSLKEW